MEQAAAVEQQVTIALLLPVAGRRLLPPVKEPAHALEIASPRSIVRACKTSVLGPWGLMCSQAQKPCLLSPPTSAVPAMVPVWGCLCRIALSTCTTSPSEMPWACCFMVSPHSCIKNSLSDSSFNHSSNLLCCGRSCSFMATTFPTTSTLCRSTPKRLKANKSELATGKTCIICILLGCDVAMAWNCVRLFFR